MKRLLLALLIGCGLTFVLVTTLKLRADSALSHLLRNGADVLLFPGYVVSLGLSLGRFHDIRFGVVVSANAAIYSGLAYLSLVVWKKLNAKSNGLPQTAKGHSTPSE
jgi:hypothetical protein